MRSPVGLLVFLAACGPTVGAVSSHHGPSSGALSLSASASTLVFNPDWTSQVFGELTPGTTVDIQYAPDRLGACTGAPDGGLAQWELTAFYELGDGPVSSTVVSGTNVDGGVNPTFVVPAGDSSDLALWFEVTNTNGCSSWDSAYGANYHFSTQSYPTVQFNSGWTINVVGSLSATSGLLVAYDWSRLPQCRASYEGFPAWSILAWYRWNLGQAQNVPVYIQDGDEQQPASPLLVPPAGANNLQLWFENSDESDCLAWDSNYGANYSFNLQ
jgi:hypothetical protein